MRCSALILGSLAACGRVNFDSIGTSSHDAAAPGDGTADAPATTSGLLAWWKLDEGSGVTAVDSVGGFDGQLTGNSSLPSWVTGQVGTALSFVGDGDRVTIGAPAALANLAGVTVSAWVRPSSVVAVSQAHCVLDKGTGLAGWAFQLAELGDGDIAFRNYYGGSAVLRISSPGILSVGIWRHVAATWDGTGAPTGIHLYVRGDLGWVETGYAAGATTGTGARPDEALVPLGINCISNTTFMGALDDIRLYGRVLSLAEIALL